MTTVEGSGEGEAVAVGVDSGSGVGVGAGVDGTWVGVEVKDALVGVCEGIEVGAGVVDAGVGGGVLGAVVGAATAVGSGVVVPEEQAANQIAIKMASDNVSMEDRRIDMETPFSSFAS